MRRGRRLNGNNFIACYSARFQRRGKIWNCPSETRILKSSYIRMGHEMAFTNRISLIKKIEELRPTVICYLTSVRPNLAANMSEDAVRVFFEHMLLLPQRPVKKIDVFLCSNGGSGTVPWRLISLLREFGESVGVLIPYRAYSAAALLALGANDIVMHPFAEMGGKRPVCD